MFLDCKKWKWFKFYRWRTINLIEMQLWRFRFPSHRGNYHRNPTYPNVRDTRHKPEFVQILIHSWFLFPFFPWRKNGYQVCGTNISDWFCKFYQFVCRINLKPLKYDWFQYWLNRKPNNWWNSLFLTLVDNTIIILVSLCKCTCSCQQHGRK